jgi:serine/threonine protein kinase
MKEWQTTFYPTCNSHHEFDLRDSQTNLFGTNGYWRDAWKLEHSIFGSNRREKVVLKTLKYNHRFEDKYFEHHRVDAVAMERLTSSSHVLDIYSYCGNSVFMEFADGPRFIDVADEARGAAKLQLARDIAEGIADVHSIDGDDYATLTHFDINLSNIGIVNGKIKLNDFNIAVLRKWNMTSNEPCGFPSRYPNPQWRSPEEARGSQLLTEKVDVYSMGNIFFRLICKHVPWRSFERGHSPSVPEINGKVQLGIHPVIPRFVRESTDFATVAIREAMLAAYTSDPKKRPSARSIANDLKNAQKKISEVYETDFLEHRKNHRRKKNNYVS